MRWCRIASQIVDAAQEVKTTNARGIEQLHEYTRSLRRKTAAIDHSEKWRRVVTKQFVKGNQITNKALVR